MIAVTTSSLFINVKNSVIKSHFTNYIELHESGYSAIAAHSKYRYIYALIRRVTVIQ